MLDRLFPSSHRHRYDIAYIGDFRHCDDATSLVADEIAAQARAGYSTLLVQADGPGLPGNPPIRPAIRACVARGEAAVLDGSAAEVSARLGILHDPISFAFAGEAHARLRLERAVAVVNAPVFDSAGAGRFDPARMAEAAEARLGTPIEWAPAWPHVRRQLRKLANGPALLDLDWSPVIDARRWTSRRSGPRGRVPAAGRHSRPEERFWPDAFGDLLKCYPVSDSLDVKLLGVPARLLRPFSGHMPGNWTLYEFDSLAPERFLRSIDFFLHSQHARWPHAIDRGVLEALAGGLVAVVPPRLAAAFGDACVYANPGWDSLTRITALHRDAEAFAEQAARGQAVLAERFAPERHAERLQRLIGRPAKRRADRKSVV